MDVLTNGTVPKGTVFGIESDKRIRIGNYLLGPDDFAEAMGLEGRISTVVLSGEGTEPAGLTVSKMLRNGNPVLQIGGYEISEADLAKVAALGAKETKGKK